MQQSSCTVIFFMLCFPFFRVSLFGFLSLETPILWILDCPLCSISIFFIFIPFKFPFCFHLFCQFVVLLFSVFLTMCSMVSIFYVPSNVAFNFCLSVMFVFSSTSFLLAYTSFPGLIFPDFSHFYCGVFFYKDNYFTF